MKQRTSVGTAGKDAKANTPPSDLEYLARLRTEHVPKSVRERLAGNRNHNYLGDAVLGAIDGCVTTFAVVAGAVGAGFSGIVIIVLGFANLIADGFSMAVSNYLSSKSQRDQVEKARRAEQHHIAVVPEGEREEIRQIFERKGFSGDVLEKIVAVITSDRRLWVDTMLTEELGLQIEGRQPVRAALATFTAFVVVGLIPLLSFVIPGLHPTQRFLWSAVLTALAFTSVGIVKGIALEHPKWRSGLETLLTGGGAALLAYIVGLWLRQAYGIN